MNTAFDIIQVCCGKRDVFAYFDSKSTTELNMANGFSVESDTMKSTYFVLFLSSILFLLKIIRNRKPLKIIAFHFTPV